MDRPPEHAEDSLRRWRLILGRYASQPLAHAAFSAADWQTEQALEYLYGREYEGRGLARAQGAGGSLDPSQLRAIDWLNRSRKLFPREVFERMQAQAVERYQLTELLSDPDTLRAMDATPSLAKALLGLRGRLSAGMREVVREVIAKTVDEITRKLRNEFVSAITGRRNRQRRSLIPTRRASMRAPPSRPTSRITTPGGASSSSNGRCSTPASSASCPGTWCCVWTRAAP